MPRWEYTVSLVEPHPDEIHKHLNALGNEGWELVSVVGMEVGGGTSRYTLYLKRPR